MRRGTLLLAAVLVCRCSASPPAPASAPSRPSGRAPFDAAPGTNHSIAITIDSQEALDILASLSRPRFQMSDVKILEDQPAIHLSIEDSGRPAEVYERDFAAAFDEQARAAVFDFRSIRQARERWQALAGAVASRRDEIARLASRRAASLLPADRAITANLRVYLIFGLAGLSDHLIVRRAEEEVMIIDILRALGDSEGEPLDSQVSRLARLIAGAAFREAWDVYRSESAAWKGADASLGQLEPLLKAVAAAGPASLYAIDENFFPLFVWLKDPMRRAVDDFNRRAERLAESRENLERRLELMTEMRRPEFVRRVAGPDGAFLTDAVFQSGGIEELRACLARGPRAFFEAYDRAAQTNKDLIALAKPIRDQLHAASPGARPN